MVNYKNKAIQLLKKYLSTVPDKGVYGPVYNSSYDRWFEEFSMKYDTWIPKFISVFLKRLKTEQYHNYVKVGKSERIINSEFIKQYSKDLWVIPTFSQQIINNIKKRRPYAGIWHLVDLEREIIYSYPVPINHKNITEYNQSITNDCEILGLIQVFPPKSTLNNR